MTADEAARPPKRRPWRTLAWGLGALLALSIPLLGRGVYEGRAELDRAGIAAASEDVEAEIEHLGRAARWRVPLASHDETAIDRLMEIARGQEERGVEGSHLALAAYREARGALLSTRSWGVARPDVFEAANARIAALMAAQEQRFGMDLSGTGEQEAYHNRLLAEIPGPDPWRANLAALAFVGWLATAIGFAVRALDAKGALRPKLAVRWGLANLALLVAWLVLLRFAE